MGIAMNQVRCKASGKIINHSIGRHPKSRTKQAVIMNGREAVTKYKVNEKFDGLCLNSGINSFLWIELFPEISTELIFIGNSWPNIEK